MMARRGSLLSASVLLHHCFAFMVPGLRRFQEHGASYAARTVIKMSNEITPLHTAAEEGNTEAVKALVAAGASLEAKADMLHYNECHREMTPLHVAARNGRPETVEALLAAGANVDGVLAKSNKRTWRATQIESGDDGQGQSQTPLNRAAQHGHTAIVALLLEHGANPSLVNTYQQAGPLTYAVMRAHR